MGVDNEGEEGRRERRGQMGSDNGTTFKITF